MELSRNPNFKSIQEHQEAMRALGETPVKGIAAVKAIAFSEIPSPAPGQVVADDPSSWMIPGTP